MTPDGTVVFGAFNFSESTILANIYAQAATAAGVPTEVLSVGPREVVYPQLFNGELGVVPEYSGTAVVALGGEATSDTAKTHDALVDLMKPKERRGPRFGAGGGSQRHRDHARHCDELERADDE